MTTRLEFAKVTLADIDRLTKMQTRFIKGDMRPAVLTDEEKAFIKRVVIQVMDAGLVLPPRMTDICKRMGVLPQCFSQVRQ